MNPTDESAPRDPTVDVPPPSPPDTSGPAGPLGLRPGEHWTDPQRTRREVIERLAEDGATGLLLDVPASVSLDLRETLPAVLLHGVTMREAEGLVFENTALVVAARTDLAHVYVGNLLTPRVLDELPDPDAEPPGEGCLYDLYTADLREALGLPWQPSGYVVTVILRDRVSNRATVTLEGSRLAWSDPEVVALRERRQRELSPPAVWPLYSPPVPSYRPTPRTPPMPTTPGIALAADRVVVLAPGARALLAGSFRVTARRYQYLPPGDPSGYTAVVPVTLVLTGSVYPEALVIRLGVPTRDPTDPATDACEVTGCFTVDLLRFDALADPAAQTLFAYAFADVAMAGPVPVALVAEDQLPHI